MFDVFVRGVNPDRIGEIEEIKQNVTQTLGISGNDLEMLIAANGDPVCIQENIPEEHAIKIRTALVNMGLVCDYKLRPGNRWGELSIVDIDKPDGDEFVCPACHEKHQLEGEEPPVRCPSCNVHIEKYEQEQKEQKEYQELRETLLRRTNARSAMETQAKQKDADKKRKEALEQKVAAELGIKLQRDWRSLFDFEEASKSQKIMAGVALTAVLGFAVFSLLPEKKPPAMQMAKNTSQNPEQTAGESAANSGPDAEQIPEYAGQDGAAAAPEAGGNAVSGANSLNVQDTLKQAQQIQANSVAQANSQLDIADIQGSDSGLQVADGQTAGQASLGKAHADVAKFLNSLGISAEAEAAKAAAGSAGAQSRHPGAAAAMAQTIAGQGVAPASSAADAPAGASTANASETAALPVQSGNRHFSDSIYHELNNDAEWNAYLLKKASDDAKAGKLKSAYALSQYQPNLSDQITVNGELLTSFAKLGRNDLIDSTVTGLKRKIQAQPPEQQAIHKAQLGVILQKLGNGASLLDEAEQQTSAISDPVKQSRVYSNLAVSQKSAGLADYNKNFALAEDKLKNSTAGFEQFSGYIALAQDYRKAGNTTNAEVAMILAELSLAKLEAAHQEQGLVMLLDTAYSLDDSAYINKFSGRLKDADDRSKSAYQNIRSQLQDGGSGNVSRQLANIGEADYSSVANAAAASLITDSTAQTALLGQAQLKLLQISDNESKSLASSKVARYLARQGQVQQAQTLFDQAQTAAEAISNHARRDAALTSVAVDKARVFLTDSAQHTAGLIHDEQLKTAAQDMINSTQAVKLAAQK